jgi:uncharacterized protein YgbK (DUF1537 family)
MDDQNQNDQTYRKKIQNSIINIIKEKLKNKEMTAKRAEELARYVLDSFSSENNKEEIYEAVKNFDASKFPELIPISTVAIMEKVEEKIKVIAEKLAFLIKNRRFDEADKLLTNLKI